MPAATETRNDVSTVSTQSTPFLLPEWVETTKSV